MKLKHIMPLFLQAVASYGKDVLYKTNTGRNRIMPTGILVLGGWGVSGTATKFALKWLHYR